MESIQERLQVKWKFMQKVYSQKPKKTKRRNRRRRLIQSSTTRRPPRFPLAYSPSTDQKWDYDINSSHRIMYNSSKTRSSSLNLGYNLNIRRSPKGRRCRSAKTRRGSAFDIGNQNENECSSGTNTDADDDQDFLPMPTLSKGDQNFLAIPTVSKTPQPTSPRLEPLPTAPASKTEKPPKRSVIDASPLRVIKQRRSLSILERHDVPPDLDLSSPLAVANYIKKTRAAQAEIVNAELMRLQDAMQVGSDEDERRLKDELVLLLLRDRKNLQGSYADYSAQCDAALEKLEQQVAKERSAAEELRIQRDALRAEREAEIAKLSSRWEQRCTEAEKKSQHATAAARRYEDSLKTYRLDACSQLAKLKSEMDTAMAELSARKGCLSKEEEQILRKSIRTLDEQQTQHKKANMDLQSIVDKLREENAQLQKSLKIMRSQRKKRRKSVPQENAAAKSVKIPVKRVMPPTRQTSASHAQTKAELKRLNAERTELAEQVKILIERCKKLEHQHIGALEGTRNLSDRADKAEANAARLERWGKDMEDSKNAALEREQKLTLEVQKLRRSNEDARKILKLKISKEGKDLVSMTQTQHQLKKEKEKKAALQQQLSATLEAMREKSLEVRAAKKSVEEEKRNSQNQKRKLLNRVLNLSTASDGFKSRAQQHELELKKNLHELSNRLGLEQSLTENDMSAADVTRELLKHVPQDLVSSTDAKDKQLDSLQAELKVAHERNQSLDDELESTRKRAGDSDAERKKLLAVVKNVQTQLPRVLKSFAQDLKKKFSRQHGESDSDGESGEGEGSSWDGEGESEGEDDDETESEEVEDSGHASMDASGSEFEDTATDDENAPGGKSEIKMWDVGDSEL